MPDKILFCETCQELMMKSNFNKLLYIAFILIFVLCSCGDNFNQLNFKTGKILISAKFPQKKLSTLLIKPETKVIYATVYGTDIPFSKPITSAPITPDNPTATLSVPTGEQNVFAVAYGDHNKILTAGKSVITVQGGTNTVIVELTEDFRSLLSPGEIALLERIKIEYPKSQTTKPIEAPKIIIEPTSKPSIEPSIVPIPSSAPLPKPSWEPPSFSSPSPTAIKPIEILAPVITGIIPDSGRAGITIKIEGKNFDTTPENNIVKFNDIKAKVLYAFKTALLVEVPYNAETGYITVTTNYSTAKSPNVFTLLISSEQIGFPVINNISPSSGIIGQGIVITGNSFNPNPTQNIVLFNNIQARVFSATSTTLVVRVPQTATTGTVTVTTSVGKTLPVDFTVLDGGNIGGGTAFGTILTGYSTWLNPIVGGNGTISNNAGTSEFPQIAIGGDGTLHVVWYETTVLGYDIMYSKSTDGGTTWSSEVNISNNAGWSDTPQIAIEGDGTLHVVWRDYTPGNTEIMYKKSSDGGVTWTNSITAGNGTISNNAGVSYEPQIAIGGDGALHVVWMDDTTGSTEIMYKKSSDGGITWTNPIIAGNGTISNNAGPSAEPQIAIAGDGILHIVWMDDILGNYEIMYKQGLP